MIHTTGQRSGKTTNALILVVKKLTNGDTVTFCTLKPISITIDKLSVLGVEVESEDLGGDMYLLKLKQ